jgi:hypothetical protein
MTELKDGILTINCGPGSRYNIPVAPHAAMQWMRLSRKSKT